MGVDEREMKVLGYMQFLMSTHKKKCLFKNYKKNWTTLGSYKMAYDLRPIK